MEKDRKDSLLRIGERLFALHGYREVSIRDITEAAGLSMGSFYTYFPGKESFYAEILDRIEQRGTREVEKHVNSFHSPLNKLKALYRYTTLSLGSNEILRGIYRGERRFLHPGLETPDRRPQHAVRDDRRSDRRDTLGGGSQGGFSDRALSRSETDADRDFQFAPAGHRPPEIGGSPR